MLSRLDSLSGRKILFSSFLHIYLCIIFLSRPCIFYCYLSGYDLWFLRFCMIIQGYQVIVIFGRLERELFFFGRRGRRLIRVALSKIRKKILNFINRIMHGFEHTISEPYILRISPVFTDCYRFVDEIWQPKIRDKTLSLKA